MTMPNWGSNVGNESGYFNPRDGVNQLLVVWVLRHIPNAGPTSYQPQGTDAIEVDIVKINQQDPARSETFRSQWIRSGRAIGALKPFIGKSCLITFYEEVPGRESTRKLRFIANEPGVQELASAWYSSLGDEGFVPSAPTSDEDIQMRITQRMQQAQQQQGWPPGSMTPQQYYQQQTGGYGAPQPGYGQQPQQWAPPPQVTQQSQAPWGGPQTGQSPQQQWGGPPPQQQQQQWGGPPPQQQQQWGGPQPPAQQQWGAPPQQAPQQQWGGQPPAPTAPPQQQQWGTQQAPAQQAPQWGAQQPVSGPPQASWGAPAAPAAPQGGNAVLDMIAGSQAPQQETPPF